MLFPCKPSLASPGTFPLISMALNCYNTPPQHWRESVIWENHLHPSSDASRVTNNHFLLTESPWKVNPGSMFFLSDTFFKDVCIDFINANITMFIIQKEVITASVLIILGPEPQSISCSSVSCFYLMFLELCLKKHWRKNKDHQGFVHK